VLFIVGAVIVDCPRLGHHGWHGVICVVICP